VGTTSKLCAQTNRPKTNSTKQFPMDKFALGLGAGLDYGGLGANFTVYPQKNIGIFAGIGYGAIQLGYNFGLKARLTFNQHRPLCSLYILGMYGYNTVFKINGLSSLNKMFYGPSVGLGFETPVKPNKTGFWSFGLLLPIRSTEAMDYYDQLKQNPNISMKNELLPFALSIGYKFNIR
jgi:hypothetical protein